MNNLKIFCPHHRPLSHRKNYILEKEKEYNFKCEFIECYEPGKDMTINNPFINDANLSLNLKHFEIYKKMINENINFSFIIEDDIIIDRDLNVFFNNILNESENYDIIFFGGTYNMVVRNHVNDKLVYGGYKESRCTHGYFITKKCAELIINNFDLNFISPIDHTLNFLINKLNLNCAWTYPHLLQKTVEGLESSTLR